MLVLTVAFLGALLARRRTTRSDDVRTTSGRRRGVDARTFAGAILLGLAMFATLFLGVVLAVFLTLGVVRGDAERGLLQPLVVRPIGRVDAARRALPRRGGGLRAVRRSSSTSSRC